MYLLLLQHVSVAMTFRGSGVMNQGTFVPRVAFLTTHRSNPIPGASQQDTSGANRPPTLARRSTISTTSTKKELAPVRDGTIYSSFHCLDRLLSDFWFIIK